MILKIKISTMTKKVTLLCVIIMSVCAQAQQDLITIVLMVKNEEAVIEKTLEPFVEGGITSFFIFDTGSTDNTISITELFFKKHNIEHYVILQEPFIDFGTSRNRALDLAD